MNERRVEVRRIPLPWVPVVVALTWAGRTTGSGDNGRHLVVVALVCGIAGAFWQLAYRRDLTDRLTHVAALFTVFVIFFLGLAAWHSHVSSSLGFGVGAFAVLTGLVYTEQALRGRDRRSIAAESRRRFLVRPRP